MGLTYYDNFLRFFQISAQLVITLFAQINPSEIQGKKTFSAVCQRKHYRGPQLPSRSRYHDQILLLFTPSRDKFGTIHKFINLRSKSIDWFLYEGNTGT